MKKTMTRVGYFFLVLTLVTAALGLFAKEKEDKQQAVQIATEQPQLPDEDSTYFNSILSALGGFSGCGLLLIFLLRRLVNNYDETFAKWETRCSNHNTKQDVKNDKIIEMIEDVQGAAQELKMEIIKLQANSLDKDVITEAITKVSMLELDVDQVRGEIKSIMTHLLNKPRISGINNVRG